MSRDDTIRTWKNGSDLPEPQHPAGSVDLTAVIGGQQAPTSEDLFTWGCCSAKTWCGGGTCW